MKKNNTLGLNSQLTRKSLYVAMATISHLMLSATPALAGPAGGKVVGGNGSIDQSGLNTTIHQQTDRMAIDWQSFNVATDEKVKFIQPGSSSVALNRVLSHTGSEIHGQIEANGHILLVNPNGVFFGENSHINVGGMIASGLHIDPNDFMNGEFTLTAIEGTEGKVINSGIINATTGGSVTLVGQQVKNEGLISAKLGVVNLAAGKEAVITFDASGLVGVRVTEEVLQNELGVDAAVINSGEINAEGGRILLSASTSQDIFSQAVNHGNLNSATSVVVHEDGSFTLGAGADVVNTGNLSVSSTSGGAGQIVLVGENITTSGNIHADAATTSAGQIELHSVDTTLITDSAKITAKTSSAGKGGDVKILGNKVGLLDNAQINASGANGGGEILFGGDESGNNIRIRNADFIYLGENSKVNADAILNGNGGRLITFASDTARIYGELSARGGSLGGNGGFVETSGLKGFEILQTPTITATAGKAGTWLIDPYDIVIKDGGPDVIPGDGKFTSTESDSTVSIDSINTVLNSGGSVIIQTGGDEGQGNITVSDNIEYDIDDDEEASLTLNAGNNIIFESDIFINKTDGNSGSLNLHLNAGVGDITFNSGSYIGTSGGDFSASGQNFDVSTGTGNPVISTDGGDILLDMSGAVWLRREVKTNGGNFTVENSSSFSSYFPNAKIDTSGNEDNRNGGLVTLTANGDIKVASISTNGAQGVNRSDSRTGGTGGLVSLISNAGSIEVGLIDTSGGDGLTFGNSSRNGGDAGDITITVQAAEQHIGLKGDLIAQGGKRGFSDHQNGKGKDISINGSVRLADNIEIHAGVKSGASGAESRGSITFNGSVDSDSTTTARNLRLTAKDVTFRQDVGRIYRLGNLNINAVGNVVARSDESESIYRNIFARSLNETTVGDVATNFHVGNINTAATAADTAGGSITIEAEDIRVGGINSSGLGTANGGAVEITASGDGASIKLEGDINSQAGSGNNQEAVDIKLRSAGSIFLNTDFFTSTVDITGSSGIDTLKGFGIDSTWSIDGVNSGNIGDGASTKVKFTKFENLVGGDGKDTFTFSGLNNTGSISHIEGGGGENTLIGRDAKSTWEIGETNSLLTDNNSSYVTTFENINILQGGSNADTFNIEAAFTGGLLGGDGNDQFIFSSSGSAKSVDGEAGTDTLIGRDVVNNTWTIDTDIRSLKETGDDKSYVENFNDIEILKGLTGIDTFEISESYSGSLFGGDGDDVFIIRATIDGDIHGNAGNDKFTITAVGITASLDGGDDDGDSLTTSVDTDTNVWTISGANVGSLFNGGTVNFKGMNTLNGGSGIDTFLLNEDASFGGTINGGFGVNQLANSNSNTSWTLTARHQGNLTNASSNTIASFRNIQTIAGSGSDSLIGRDQANDWQITGENSGYLQIMNGTVDRIDFSGMNNLTGRAKTDRFTFQDAGIISGNVNGGDGSGVDTLVGRNTENLWSIDNNNQGNISTTDTSTSPYVKFFDIENLLGGRDADTFSFIGSGHITGEINGGTHNEQEIVDTLDLGSLSHGVTVALFKDNDSPNLYVLNMDRIIAPSDRSMTNFLYGASDQPYTWTIDSTNSGTLTASDPAFESSVEFFNFGQLRGGTNDDRFEVITGGSITGTIHGGDGDGKDFVDYSGSKAHVAIALSGDGSVGVTGIDGIEGVIGNNDGTSQNPYYSLISIADGNNIWTIGNPETDGINDGQIAINGSSTKVISFENFNILNGGTGNDEFNLSVGGQFIGYINGGGGGVNSFNAIASSVDQTVYINSSAIDLDGVAYVAGATQLFGFDTITANAGTQSTLISNENANTWIIRDGTNLLSVDGNNINFDGFSKLVGGTEADSFYIHSLDDIPAVIDGGTGAADYVYFTPLNPAVGVTVGVGDVPATIDLNVFNIENLVGHNNGTNTLISNGTSDSWVINGSNQGTLNSDLNFSGFANLTGGDGDDKFSIVGENAALSGTMNGGAGNDLLSFIGRAATLELFSATLTDDNFNAIDFEIINADDTDESFSNTLIAGNTKNDWVIDSLNAGTVNNGALTTTFKGFKNLIGGIGIDEFIFEGSGSLGGYIDGGILPNNGVDSVNLSGLSNADVSLGNTTYRNIEKIIGNGSSVLTSSEASIWNLLGHNSGNVNNILFEGFSSLVGGDYVDQFNLTQGSLSGFVKGGKGDDIFQVSGATITGSVFGDAGNDHFIAIITPDSQGQVRFEGGVGNNSLEARGGNTEYRVQHDASNGEFSYTDKQNNKYNLSYTGITNINDNVLANLLEITTTSAADTITLKKDAYSLNQINVNYKNKSNLTIAASAADEVIVSGAVNITGLLTIQDARVSAADNNSVITASGLLLDGTAEIGTATNRVNVDIDDLYIRYANGAIYLKEQSDLNIAEFFTGSLLDLHLDGDLTSSVALSSSQDINITASGDIVLDKGNTLNGALNLAAGNSINLRNLTTTNLKNVSARNLTVNSTGVINGGGLIQVDGLASLVSGGNINLANQNHNFNFVQIGSAANVSINNADSLRLTGVSASGALNINAQGINVDGSVDTASIMLNAGQGDAVLSGNVAVDGIANVVGRNITVDGDLLAANIQLDGSQGQVLINGRLNTDGKESITVAANQVVQNGLISAGTGVIVKATDSITQNAGITAATDVLLSAGGDLFMNARHITQGQQVNYSAGGNMGLADINATKGINISAAGNVNQRGNIASSAGDIIIDSGRYNMEAGSALTANAGSVLLASSADVTTRKISAATEVSLTASGNVQILDEVATTQGAISIQGGSVTLASNLIGNTGIEVVSANGNIQQQAQLNSAQGDIRVAAGGDIAMGAGSSTLSTNGSINYSGANLGITSLDALKTVTLAATRGAVTDVNGEDNNITAQRLVIDAATGIGSNDIIETLVEELSVSNNVGDIRLQNNKAVTVDRLRSNGNIVFNNLIGSVMLDNSQGTLFSRTETDARLAGGTINANYDIGTLTINVAAGDLTATGVADLKNPDIVARNAALIAPIGNIGTFGRPLVIYVKDSLFIAGFNSWNPFWAFGVSPATVDNASTIQGDLSDLLASGNETLVVVEALNEVDPAIFTNVRNYFYDDVSILLPTDQLYYGE